MFHQVIGGLRLASRVHEECINLTMQSILGVFFTVPYKPSFYHAWTAFEYYQES
jgi:hypothetical protein